MTVKELKEQLNNFPESMDIFIEKTDSEFQYSLLEKSERRIIVFVDGKLKAKDSCVVLTDEF